MPLAGERSSVRETAEIKHEIENKNEHQESARCDDQNDSSETVCRGQLMLQIRLLPVSSKISVQHLETPGSMVD
jgi:hypothetical protein